MSRSTLRAQLALSFAAAVGAALILFSAGVVLVFNRQEQAERQLRSEVCREEDDRIESVQQVLLAIGLIAPAGVLAAAGFGWLLARRALRPLQEAAANARAARVSEVDLRLPLRGTGDEWDDLAATINQLIEEQRSALRRIRGFTADAAHELRTPLTAIIGEAEVSLRKERSVEGLRAALGVAHAEGTRLSVVLDGLLLLARGDTGSLVARRERVSIKALVEEAGTRVRQRLGAARIEVEGADASTPVEPFLLGRAVENLFENALRHGGARTWAKLVPGPATLEIQIFDDGPGVDPALAPTMFERFVRGDSARQEGGTGLGLSIGRSIAEAHGGTLRFWPQPLGSCFVLSIPR